jgi:hypothetical protein
LDDRLLPRALGLACFGAEFRERRELLEIDEPVTDGVEKLFARASLAHARRRPHRVHRELHHAFDGA